MSVVGGVEGEGGSVEGVTAEGALDDCIQTVATVVE